ncbi:hypothetical protein FDENT_4359 [Fusarium denticulatum]|uniref:Uncharacterized protein n=1 Tax=Fusarium denticulatum TaxID=48507 RepID=A0A8H5XA51_9HYPO|nr:hypothetical protein FDENT_4359 [Fusarium denticulatum]
MPLRGKAKPRKSAARCTALGSVSPPKPGLDGDNAGAMVAAADPAIIPQSEANQAFAKVRSNFCTRTTCCVVSGKGKSLAAGLALGPGLFYPYATRTLFIWPRGMFFSIPSYTASSAYKSSSSAKIVDSYKPKGTVSQQVDYCLVIMPKEDTPEFNAILDKAPTRPHGTTNRAFECGLEQYSITISIET